jgi:hypothetical protein
LKTFLPAILTLTQKQTALITTMTIMVKVILAVNMAAAADIATIDLMSN